MNWKHPLLALDDVIKTKLRPDNIEDDDYTRALDDIRAIIWYTIFGVDKEEFPDAIDLTQWYDEHKV